MKLIRLSILFSLISAIGVQKVNAQAFKAEIIGGTNISQVDGDEVFGFLKYGVNMGLGVVMPIHKNWSLSFETLYTQKGSRLGKVYSDSLDGSYKLHLNYAEVPFLIQYTDRDRASAGIGFSWGRLVAVNEWKNGYRVDSVTLLDGPFSRNDWQILADLRLKLYKNLRLNARYAYSMKKIATRNVRDSMSGVMNVRDFYNNLWSIRLIYTINESEPDKIKKNAPNE